VNNGVGGGIAITGSVENTLGQLALDNSGTNIMMASNPNNNKFTGNLLITSGATCSVMGGTNPGLVDLTCANNGASNANLVTGVSLASSFVGKVDSGQADVSNRSDTANSSDTDGWANYAANMDWLGFDNFFRGWGNDGNAFPDITNRDRCVSGICRIWDWRLSGAVSTIRGNSGNGLTGNGVFTGGAACPAEANGDRYLTSKNFVQDTTQPSAANGIEVSGNMNGTCEDTETCYHRYLKSASEIMGDSIGDDDGLCESGEACLYTPNFGAYQGHGALSTCIFSANGGPVTGVTMNGYASNGAP
jgi:hypothetical protein